MEWFNYFFAKADSPETLQTIARGVLVFIAAPVILRAGGMRTFGNCSPADKLVLVILGGVLSRVVTGAAAFFPAMAATIAIVIINRLFAWLSLNKTTASIIMGTRRLLFENGVFHEKNMRKALINREDLEEAVRLQLNTDDFIRVSKIFMERNGEISTVMKVES